MNPNKLQGEETRKEITSQCIIIKLLQSIILKNNNCRMEEKKMHFLQRNKDRNGGRFLSKPGRPEDSRVSSLKALSNVCKNV